MAANRPQSPSGAGGAAPTLEALVSQRLRAGARPRGAIGRADRSRPLPLSAGQQQMWFLHRLDPAGTAYLMTWQLLLSGALDAEAMRRAWEGIVERHEILRTRYDGGGAHAPQGAGRQIIDPPGRFELRTVDLAGAPAARRELRARQIADWERRRPFDLTAEAPLRVTLIVLGTERHLLVIHMHHIACDGAQRLAAELEELYRAHTEGRAPGLAPVPVQYADFAAWELAGRRDGRLRPHLDYWRRELSEAPAPALPLDRPRPRRPDWRGGAIDVVIAPETAHAVHALAAEYRTSPYVVLLAAYQVLLAHLSGGVDVTVGVPVSVRLDSELDALVGYLVNTVAVRVRHARQDTFADLLGQVRTRFLEAFDHRAAPFAWVVEEVNPVRDGGANPLYQAAFDMEIAQEGTFRLAGLHTEQLELSRKPPAKFDLTLHVLQAAQGLLYARLEYAAALLDEQTVLGWASYAEALLAAAVREPHVPLERLRERLRERLHAKGLVPTRLGPQAQEPAAVDEEPAAGGVRDATGREALSAVVHRAWCEVLGLEEADPQANFFDVGGDSLRAVALAALLRAQGLETSATDIFAYQTIAELVDACGGGLEAAPREPEPGIAPFALLSAQDREALLPGLADAYPLAAAQLGMIVEMRSRPDLNTYQDTTSFLIRGAGALDALALQRAAQRVVDRHEVLRTGFDLSGYSVPLQLVHAEAVITVGVTRHGPLGPEGWLPLLKQYAASERSSLMDLARPPLIRVHAHTAEGAPQWWITITECHPILEGWSFHTMLMEILTGYRELAAGREPVPPEMPAFRYAHYIAAEAAARRSPQDQEYWRNVVGGRREALLPSAWQGDQALPAQRYQRWVPYRDLEADLRRLAAETRTSMKAVMLAAHLTVMSTVSGARDFYTGLVCDARPEALGADRALGMFLNTLPFAMPSGARTWGALVKAVYDQLTELWPHRVYPMQVIQKELGGGRLLEVFFNYLDFHQVDGDLVDEEQIYNDNVNEFALHVSSISGVVKMITTSHCLSQQAAGRLLALYRSVLEEMALGPDGEAEVPRPAAPQGAHGLAPGGARAELREPPGVLEAFARTVRERPDAPAVRCGARTLTWAQLDERARAVAQRLRDAGAGPGSLVAVAAGRDAGLPADLLGVWMAGAAWTPLALGAPGGGHLSVSGAAAPLAAGTACVLPVEPVPDAPAAVFSHRALAHAAENLIEGYRAAGAAPQPGALWVCTAPPTSWPAAVELLAPLVHGGIALITAAHLPEAITEVRKLIDSGAAVRMRASALVAEELTAGDAGQPRAVILLDAARADAGARILDGLLRPVPVGVAGGLYLGGAALADGLHADPARTAERFVPDPAGSGSRLYHTGRLARLAEDGTPQDLGPGELYRTRELLESHPAVRDSFVTVRSGPVPGQQQVAGYVRTAAGAAFAPDEVRRYLAERRLPHRLIPQTLTAVDAWPLDALGGVDEDLLPHQGEPEDAAGAQDERPWDAKFEALLRQALASVSYDGPVTARLPLADSGMDSFVFVGFLAALEQAYGVTVPDDVPLVEMFRTPATLWTAIDELLNR